MPNPALIDAYVAGVSSVLPLNTGLPKRITETRFGLWGYDRPEIVGGDQTYERRQPNSICCGAPSMSCAAMQCVEELDATGVACGLSDYRSPVAASAA